MRIRSPFVRRWLLYGVLAAFAHLFAFCFFGFIRDAGVITLRFNAAGDVLAFSVVGFYRTFEGYIFEALPASFEVFYYEHEGLIVVPIFFANSALWGFTISAVVLYAWQGFTRPH